MNSLCWWDLNPKISSSRDEHRRAAQAMCQNTSGAAAGELHSKLSLLTPQLRVDEENPCLAAVCVCTVSAFQQQVSRSHFAPKNI